GSKPSHPELLDYLANRFIQSNWSTKTLIRDIVLSQVYGLSAEGHAGNVATDPTNQWLWRFQPKRVDVEVLRDSMLALSGKLDRTRGGKTLQHLGLVSLGGDHICLESPSPYARRTVYIPIYRDTVGLATEIDASMGMLKAFDFADPNLMTGARTNTVVPAQTLFLMNADFVYEQAQGLAFRILEDAATTDERIERLTELVYGRGPTELERGEFKQFLDTFQVQATDEPVENHLTRAGDSQASASTAAEQPAWTALCQSMFGSNEFLFLD
ncbi:MAG: DUF1553 domain-containing protein, partial [bacterium]|nr:DUF1553 domain-containing protein [bacterium]